MKIPIYKTGIFYLTLILLAMVVFGGDRYRLLSRDFGDLILEHEELKIDFAELNEEKIVLEGELALEKDKNKTFESQISQIAGTIGKLDKLSKTDKELLQKYSKVYFLNEHYAPDALTDIPPDYLLQKERVARIHEKVFPYLQQMLVEAKNNGINLQIVSAYRSFSEQNSLKNQYTVTYGSGANKFSADQGYSEHQLGTAVDFTTIELGANFTGFAKTEAYKWLQENAYKYGFVISYPPGNAYYQFEPWHYRFVGKSLALRLHEEKENFYDLPQSKIDAYLINIFD